MALIVGTDTYATMAEYQAYAADYGWTLEADGEVALRKARKALDLSYIWRGSRQDDAQLLEWPRDLAQDTPEAIKAAQMELAYLMQGGADPLATLATGAIKRKREKVDVIEEETEYADGTARERPAYPAVDALVAAFVVGKIGARTGSIRLARA